MAEATQPGADESIGAAARQIEGLLEKSAQPQQEAQEEETQGTEVQEKPEDGQLEQPTEGEQTTEETEKPDQSEVEEGAEEVRTLADVAKALGVEESQLLNLTLTRKVDGQDTEATLNDLISSYQFQGHLNRKSDELSQAKRQVEETYAQAQQAISQRIQQLDDVILGVSVLIQGEDIEALKDNPEEYLLAKERQRDREARINQAFQERQRWMQEQQQQQEQYQQGYLQEQVNKLPEYIPEWRDQSKRSQESQKIAGYLSQMFSSDEIGQLVDARHVAIARKAMLYDELQRSKPAITKKVVNLPKVQKPGTAPSKSDTQANQISVLAQKARKTGRKEDAAAYFEALIVKEAGT